MNYFMNIVVVPLGYADKVITAANEVGATGATILRARGADHSAKEGLFSIKIEPEEEIVLIIATKEVTDTICNKIHEEFEKNSKRGGSIYILPVQDLEE
ncbi:MAG: hypothetical protein GXY86_07995 [Firmicutes bacterium]|nr:hypothetical protein [Bacillota bacterium]